MQPLATRRPTQSSSASTGSARHASSSSSHAFHSQLTLSLQGCLLLSAALPVCLGGREEDIDSKAKNARCECFPLFVCCSILSNCFCAVTMLFPTGILCLRPVRNVWQPGESVVPSSSSSSSCELRVSHHQLLFILGVYWAGPDIASALQPIIPVWTAIIALATCTEKLPSPLNVSGGLANGVPPLLLPPS